MPEWLNLTTLWLAGWALIVVAMPVLYGFNKRRAAKRLMWVDPWDYRIAAFMGCLWPLFAIIKAVRMTNAALAWIGGRVARG